MAEKSKLPYNEIAEKAVLGSALLSQEAAITVLASLESDDFYFENNRHIFDALLYIKNERHESIDVVTLTAQLSTMKQLEDVGGVEYLKECSDAMVSLGSLEYYINIVKDNSILRKMLLTIRDIDKKYNSEDIEDISSFVSDSEELFKRSIEKRRIGDFVATRDMASMIMDKIAAAQANENGIIGLTTGFPRLDQIIQGFQPGQLIAIGARPSVGKTALALNMALKAATFGRKPVGFFCLEMTKDDIYKRLIATTSGIESKKINLGDLNQEERFAVTNGVNQIAEAALYLDDTTSAKINDIIQKTRRLQQKEPNLGLIIIDHLGLIHTPSTGKNELARNEQIRKITGDLKCLALELKIPIVILCQLNRQFEESGEGPKLSNLSDSSSIEKDADVVMFLTRNDIYNEGDKSKKSRFNTNTAYGKRMEAAREEAPKLPGNTSFTELTVAKNRNGPLGTVGLFFYKSFFKFDEPPVEWVEKFDQFKQDLQASINNH